MQIKWLVFILNASLSWNRLISYNFHIFPVHAHVLLIILFLTKIALMFSFSKMCSEPIKLQTDGYPNSSWDTLSWNEFRQKKITGLSHIKRYLVYVTFSCSIDHLVQFRGVYFRYIHGGVILAINWERLGSVPVTMDQNLKTKTMKQLKWEN